MKLNQIIAVEKEAKTRTYAEVTDLHKKSQVESLFNGFSKTYQKKDDAGEDYPPEKQLVQLSAQDLLERLAAICKPLYGLEASKEASNAVAKADVVVNGVTLIADAPVTLLLFLEKQINDIRTFVEAIPVLDPAEEWTWDPQSSLWKSAMRQTHRTKKVQKAIVLYPATTEHPAQTQLITEDEVVGYWNNTKSSGALPQSNKTILLHRIDDLSKAIKSAREEANSSEVIPMPNVGVEIFRYLFPRSDEMKAVSSV